MGACPIEIIATAEYPLLAVSATGNTTFVRQAPITTLRVSVAAGTGAYSPTITLSNIGAQAGDIFRVIVLMPASAYPTFSLIDLFTGNTLTTVASSGSAFTSLIEATFNGLSWDWDMQSA